MQTKYRIMFLTWHYSTPEIFLETLLKQTPNKSGKWGNVEATLNMAKADYLIIFDGYRGKFPEERALYFGQHPHSVQGCVDYRDFKDVKKCVATFPLEKYLNPAEWWIDYDYDTLVKLPPPKKSKDLFCAVTYQDSRPTYTHRREFLSRYMQVSHNIDLYGRPKVKFENDELRKIYKGVLGFDNYDIHKNDHTKGKEVIADYRYSLEFDMGPTTNYICERFYDAILLWTFPIYYGSTNVEQYFPKNSFRYVNIAENNMGETKKVLELVNSDFREQHMDDLAQARDLALHKYSTFARVHEIVNNLDRYTKKDNS